MSTRISTARSERSHGRPSRALPALALAVVLALSSGAVAANELTVRVDPSRAHATPGAPLLFAATVYDADGELVAAQVTWSVIPPRAGSISSDGRFVAGDEPGRAIVRALAEHGTASGSGHSVVEIGSGPLAKLDVAVEPDMAVLRTGENTQFSATVTDAVTGEPVESELRWAVLPEQIGSVDATGLFIAGESEGAGRVAVRAADGAREGIGHAAVVVGSPPDPGIGVSVVPLQALVSTGEELRFNGVVTDESGSPLDIDVDWSVMPRRLGVIGPGGVFTAGPDEGVGRIVATVATSGGPARGFALVEIRRTGPAGVRVRIRPREAAVALGGNVQFEAIAIGPDDEPLDVDIDWALRPAWIGSILSDGLFAASDEMPEPPADGVWSGTVVASVETNEGPASDAARVVVRNEGPALRLQVRPNRPVISAGQEIQFEERVIGAEGPIDWTTEWAVFPRELGIITPEGLFTPNPALGDAGSPDFVPREGVVAARATLSDGSTLSDRAHVRVRVPDDHVNVRVRPSLAVVVPGQTTHFEAEVTGANGELLDVPVFWNVRPEGLGHISPDGEFTASDVPIEPGSWSRPRGHIVAEVRIGGGQVFRGLAAIIFDLPDPEVFVRISPRSVTLSEGESFQFIAETTTADGAVVDMDLEWRVSDGSLGTVDDTGLFVAADEVPSQHSRRTTVTAGGIYNGRLYADIVTVRVSRE